MEMETAKTGTAPDIALHLPQGGILINNMNHLELYMTWLVM